MLSVSQIKKALQQCANQLSKKLAKRQARAVCDCFRLRCADCGPPRLQLAKARKARKKALTRYIPDVARAVFAVLAKARPSRGPLPRSTF